MGRHSAPEPSPDDRVLPPLRERTLGRPDAPASVPVSTPVPSTTVPAMPAPTTPAPSRTAWRDRAVLAGAATLTTGGVLAWAGAHPWTAGAGAVGAGVVVLVAAWVATTVPGRPHAAERGGQRPGGRRGDRAEHEGAGTDPVE